MAQDEVAPHRVDWEGIEASPEFKELVKRKRSFVIPGTVFFLAWYMTFICLCAFAQDFMGERVYEGLTVGYVLALTQFLMVFVLGLLYLSRSKNVFDPLAEKAIRNHAIPDGPAHGASSGADGPGAVAPTARPAKGATR
jgi:uncharacterized membrane protein (DUF485 family)